MQKAGSIQDETLRVRATILKIYKALEDLDPDDLVSHFSNSRDFLAFGTDLSDKHTSREIFRNIHEIEARAKKWSKITSKELEVHVYGDFAWTADQGNTQFEWQNGKKEEFDLRITSVLRKDHSTNEWLVVHWNVSGFGRHRIND